MFDFIFSYPGYFYIAGGFASLFWVVAILAIVSMFIELNLTYILERKYRNPAILAWMHNVMEDKGEEKTRDELKDEDVAPILFVGYIIAPAVIFLVWPLTGFVFFYYLMLRTLRFMVRIKKGVMKLVTNKKCLKDYTEKDTPEMEF